MNKFLKQVKSYKDEIMLCVAIAGCVALTLGMLYVIYDMACIVNSMPHWGELSCPSNKPKSYKNKRSSNGRLCVRYMHISSRCLRRLLSVVRVVIKEVVMVDTRLVVSRNKREGYYAGHYRANDLDYLTPVKAWRWSWFDMHEFYPPVHGNVFRMLEKEGIVWQEQLRINSNTNRRRLTSGSYAL